MVVQNVADLEFGGLNSSAVTSPVYRNPIRRCLNAAWTILLPFIPSSSRGQHEENNHPRLSLQIEDHPNGYPQFSALIASHDSFHICRRFTHLRSRLLLLKQDQLSVLEQELWKIDREESKPIQLGSSRNDNNEKRRDVLTKIDTALMDYDTFVERNHAMLSLEPAKPRNTTSLRNWIDGNGNIAREEAAFLSCSEDLASVTDTDDTVMTWLELLIEDMIFFIRKRFGENRDHNISRDPSVHIITKSTIARITRVLMTPFIITLLLAPVIICNILDSLLARLFMVVIATTAFVAVLSGSTKAKTYDLVVAGATYTTVLVVFIATTNPTE
ncbi:hypothetical protein F4820DRAFT_452427 [Hypoxylon rubiginosum]|uniref:Uncharacterized protein n=1 Tax=Hypoxylon rubiginosum TaxID=110542 RepID=A0ACB9YNI6_9PEZI|nr:hypothetical protein F4820DRAFT_452427 [Hypoxylon rubiginosum]